MKSRVRSSGAVKLVLTSAMMLSGLLEAASRKEKSFSILALIKTVSSSGFVERIEETRSFNVWNSVISHWGRYSAVSNPQKGDSNSSRH